VGNKKREEEKERGMKELRLFVVLLTVTFLHSLEDGALSYEM
jgi:hypothetical protein